MSKQRVEEILVRLREILPRCEVTGKMCAEPASADLIADRMTKRYGKTWVARSCQSCGKKHLWEEDQINGTN